MSDQPPAIDRYQIVRLLGKGGMGTVYLAKDTRLDRHVALKILNMEDVLSEERRARFLREARAAAGIRHPNVATIYEVDETPQGQPYIAMEYCDGETLAQRMRRRHLDSAEIRSLARQLAAGLAAAHDAGVVHRDIKAANIILEPSGVAKILDFGLARLLPREDSVQEKPSHESTSSRFFGTLHYLSPEQARGLPADERSDLFAIGVLLYQAATGRLPFNGDSPLLVLEQIRDAEPDVFTPLDAGFPSTLAKIIGKLLQKDPARRYQNARDLLSDLEEIDTPTALLPYLQSHSGIGRTRRRPRWVGAAIIGAAIVAVGFGIFAAWQGAARRDEQRPEPPNTPIRSLAVLPFNNLANAKADEFLSVGLADALVTELQQIPSFHVRPTSAVAGLRSGQIDAASAGKKLQVDGVIEGNFLVLAAGNLVRVNLQLTDARSGYSIWADSIDGKRTDLLALIDAVSARTATALNDRLGAPQPITNASEARSKSPQAYEEYLKARADAGSLVSREYEAQLASLRRAIALDPNFAAAHAELAIALSLGQTRGLATAPGTLQQAEWHARQAVRLDPNLAQAHLALGRVFVRFRERYRESVRENLAALRLNPKEPQALWVLTTYFVSAGEMQKAACVGDQLVGLDPSSNEAKTRGYWYVNGVDPEGALQHAAHALASDDTKLAGHDIRANAHLLLGDIASAEREAAAVSALVPDHYLGKSLRAMIAATRGDRATAEASLQSFESVARSNHWAAIRVAQTYAKLGDRQRAIEWIARAADLGHHAWHALVKHPWLAPLQSDPEFQRIVGAIKRDIDDVRDDIAGVYQLICK